MTSSLLIRHDPCNIYVDTEISYMRKQDRCYPLSDAQGIGLYDTRVCRDGGIKLAGSFLVLTEVALALRQLALGCIVVIPKAQSTGYLFNSPNNFV